MVAPHIDDVWRFGEYGSIQFVENRVTGEFLKVHGPDALFGDGPFQMINCEGRPTLVGLDGTDLQRALHVADEHASMRLLDNCGEKPGDDSIVSMDADKGRKRLRLADLKESAEAAAMIIEVAGFQPFKSEWIWYGAPTLCGDEPVNLWLDLRWLTAYLAPGSGWRLNKKSGSCCQARTGRSGVQRVACSVAEETREIMLPSGNAQG